MHSPLPRRIVRYGPACDHLVADVGVHGAAERRHGLVDTEKEAGDEVVDAKLVQVLGEAGRIGEIKEHTIGC